MKKKNKPFRKLICYLFHTPQIADLAFFRDVVSNEVVTKYYCPKCDVYFLATSQNSTFRAYCEPEQKENN